MAVLNIAGSLHDTIAPTPEELPSPIDSYDVSSNLESKVNPSLCHRFRRSPPGSPLVKAASLIGAEGFWPTDMQRECTKAARILHSFTDLPLPHGARRSLVTIPDSVLRNCAGLAIFNVLRAGAFHGSLAAGSGVVIARSADGRSWSPPSSFVVSTIGAGFMFGLDVYDCVCVLHTAEQVAAFANPRVSLGGEASFAIGPVGTGAMVDAALSKAPKPPVWSYMKSRGLWAGVQIDGTIIVSRADANAAAYEPGITAEKILAGEVAWPAEARPLFEVLRAIDGAEFNRSIVQEVGRVPSPGDVVIEKPALRVDINEVDSDSDSEWSVIDEKQMLARAA